MMAEKWCGWFVKVGIWNLMGLLNYSLTFPRFLSNIYCPNYGIISVFMIYTESGYLQISVGVRNDVELVDFLDVVNLLSTKNMGYCGFTSSESLQVLGNWLGSLKFKKSMKICRFVRSKVYWATTCSRKDKKRGGK